MTTDMIPDLRVKNSALVLNKPKVTRSDSGNWWVKYGNKDHLGILIVHDSWREAMDWAIRADQHMHWSVHTAFNKL